MSEPYCYEYPRPMVTADVVVFGLAEDGLRTLFIKRKKDPFAGHWAIPGGFIEIDEPIDAGARRELKEETGLENLAVMEEIAVFGDPGRDPRGRTISVAHAGIVRGPLPSVKGGDDASEASWLDPDTTGPLAFDHPKILARARRWLREGVETRTLGLALLPDAFGLPEIEAMLAAVLGHSVNAERWLNDRRLAGEIHEIAGSKRRFRSS
jgi:8-oxo-dGTP diphosphatase